MTCVATNMPHLSAPQARILAWWSFGIAHTRSCGRVSVAVFLALLLEMKPANIEQRLYEWCLDAPDKAGNKRQSLEVTTCFVPLLRWIVSLWHGKHLALTLDASPLSDRFVVLAISVVYRGIGLPVAWTILPAGKKQAWRREWLRMLRLLRPAIPDDWTVIVLTDRGLYARWLFRRIVRLGWHPFMRINRGAKFSPNGDGQWYWLDDLVRQGGTRWHGRGIAFKSKESHLPCTLLAWQDDAYAEPWFVLTDLDPDACAIEWYGLRSWCEQGFKCQKRGGWQWQQTQMTDPRRAERLWLALAVAMLWMVSLGSEIEVGTPDDIAELPDLQRLLGGAGRQRCLRLFRLGWLWLLARAIRAQPVPLPRHLVPEPWPGRWATNGGERAPPPG
jgi:hypothetical protein